MIKLPLLKAKIEYQQQKESFLNQISYYFISNFDLFALFMKTIWILFFISSACSLAREGQRVALYFSFNMKKCENFDRKNSVQKDKNYNWQ